MLEGSAAQYQAIICYRSPAQWLTDQFAQAVSTLEIEQQPLILLPKLVLNEHKLGEFATPLPLKLAHLKSHSRLGKLQTFTDASAVQDVGQALIEHLSQYPPQDWEAPHYWMRSNGWLYAQFSANAIAHWLQSLLAGKPSLEQQPLMVDRPVSTVNYKIGISTEPAQFELQWAYARCCSLLKLGHQSGLIQLTADEASLTYPDPIPWQTLEGTLRIQTQSEQKLLLALMAFPQSLCSSIAVPRGLLPEAEGCFTLVSCPLNNRITQTQLRVWNQLFDAFYRECRIFDSQMESSLSQARLALVLLLKNVLEFWLLNILQIEAPRTL